MYRALIVEDEPPILRKITSSLRAVSDAFDIEVAHDGQEAFEYLMNCLLYTSNRRQGLHHLDGGQQLGLQPAGGRVHP